MINIELSGQESFSNRSFSLGINFKRETSNSIRGTMKRLCERIEVISQGNVASSVGKHDLVIEGSKDVDVSILVTVLR